MRLIAIYPSILFKKKEYNRGEARPTAALFSR